MHDLGIPFRLCKWLLVITLLGTCILSQDPPHPPSPQDPEVDRYVWDLSPLYRDRAAWDTERDYVLRRIATIGQVRGTGRQGAKALADELDAVADLRTRGAKMALYGEAVSSVDSSETANMQYDVGAALRAQAEAAVAFLPQDVLSIGKTQVMEWLRSEPRLARHRVRLVRIFLEAPHTLSTDQEATVASMARWPKGSVDLWRALNHADLAWPTLKNSEGKDVTVTLNAVLTEFQGKDQVKAFEVLLQKMQSLQGIYGALYTRRIEADLIIARQRKFNDGMDALWYLHDGMPEGSHHTMIEVARANVELLQRYMKARNRSIGLDRVSYADLGLDPPGIDRRFPIADAMKIAVESSAPFGPAYQQRLRQLLQQKWMHLPPWPEKAQSFGIYPPVGGIAPYFVMSYRPDYHSSKDFAGGVTLMMSDADIPRDSVPENWDDSGIYANGVIYVGEMLHDDYRAAHAANRQEKIAFLVNALDFDLAQYFQYVVWAELDEKVQQLIIEGKPPAGVQVSQIYLDLLRQYYGHDRPQAVEDVFSTEWMTNIYPFNSYEYQFWPPGLAMAAQVVEEMLAGGDSGRRVIDELLGRSDYDRTYPMLKEVGIDITKPEPYQALIRRMNRQLDELEAQLDQKE
jgi:oligoendopeptidase F